MKWAYKKYGLWVIFFVSAILLSASIFFFAQRNKWLDKEFANQVFLNRMRDKLATINLLVKNTESGVRGYVATGKREFISNFEKNIKDIRETSHMLMTENEKQGIKPFSQMLFTLDSLVEKRIVQLQEKRAIAETNRKAAVQVLRTGPGLNLSNSISNSIALLDAEVDREINASHKTFLYVNRRNKIFAFLSLLGSLLLILVSFYFLIKEIGWRIKISNELKFQKERFRLTLKSMHDGLISTDAEGRITFMNPTAERLTGWSWREAKNQPLQRIYNVVNEETGAAIDDLLTLILKEGKTSEWENNTILQSKFNEKFIISKSAAPVLNEKEKVEGAVFVFNDITEKKKLENKIKENEMLLQSIIQTSPECIKLLGINGELQEMNRAGLAMIEADNLQQVKGKSVIDIIKEPYRKAFNDLLKNIFNGGSGMLEFEITGLKGTSRWLESHAVPLRNIEGEILSMLSVTRDITNRKKSEQEKQRALERYDILFRATSDTIWDWDIKKNKVLYNYGITQMFGYDITEVEDDPEWWLKHVHPEDSIVVTYDLQQAFAVKRQNLRFEYRYRCADGLYKHILDRAFILYDENGEPVRIIGAMQDITFQKEEETRTNKAIIDAQERERQQIGMELHDNVNQILSASLLYMGMAKNDKNAKEEIFTSIDEAAGLIRDAIAESRRLSHQLAPASFENVSLEQAFEDLVQSMNLQKQWEVSVQFEGLPLANIREDIKVTLYRILQEQLNNINKYARAGKVDIYLTRDENHIRLSIMDNGVGFDLQKVKRGIGLENIKRRAGMYNGSLTIHTSPGKGCEVMLELPLL